MDKKQIIIGAAIVAAAGVGYILYKRSKTAKDSDKKIPDNSSIQPDRKKLYDDIYIALVNYYTKNNQGSTFKSVLGDSYYNNDYNYDYSSYNPNVGGYGGGGGDYGSGYYDGGYIYNNDSSWNQKMQDQERFQEAEAQAIALRVGSGGLFTTETIGNQIPVLEPLTKRSVTELTAQQINDLVLKFYNSILPELNKMTIQELETYLNFLKEPQDIANDQELSALFTKYPKITLEGRL